MRRDRELERAEQVVDAIQADPSHAAHVAASVLASATASPESQVVARWVIGLVAREQGHLPESRTALEQAVELADRHGLGTRAAAVRVSLALTLANAGDVEAALHELGRARSDVSGIDRARLDQQEALIRQRQGRLDDARLLYRRALAEAHDLADMVLECRILSNLGVLEGYAGDVDSGIRHLTEAMQRSADTGQRLLEARAAHNLGFLEGQRSDVPAGLRWLDRAADLYAVIPKSDNDRIILESDRATLLLGAGLHEDAVRHSALALDQLGDGQESVDRAELTLLHARALRADGQVGRAADMARDAADRFDRQHRETWRWNAEVFALDCARLLGDAAPSWKSAAHAARALRAAGAALDGTRASMLAARLALDTGDIGAAAAQLASLPEPRRLSSSADRAAFWQVTAEARAVVDDRRGARRALRAGLACVDRYQRRFGSFEIRARSVEAGATMSALGLRMAVEDRRPAEMLDWLESRRASALLCPPAVVHERLDLEIAPAEPTLPGRIDLVAGRAEDASGPEHQRSVEEAVRRRRHALSGESGPALDVRADLKRLPQVLGDRVLLAFFRLDDDLHVLVQRRGRTRHRVVGPIGPLVHEIEHLCFAISRLGRRRSSRASVEAALLAMDSSAKALEATLFASLHPNEADADLVIVPTGPLHALPWRALPRCVRQHAVVVPSARVWLAAATMPRHHDPGGTLVVAGPDLPGARSEALQLCEVLANADVLLDGRATVSATRDSLAGMSTAHIAAHGRFRSDNPLFSSLRLADGEFTAHELESVRPLPSMFVLPVCQAAASAVYSGDELLGFSAALLGLGVNTVIAPITPVSDEATGPIMVALHRALAGGEPPAIALTTATESVADESAAARAAAAAFVLIGAG